MACNKRFQTNVFKRVLHNKKRRFHSSQVSYHKKNNNQTRHYVKVLRLVVKRETKSLVLPASTVCPLASPAMGHWGTCPLDFQQFIIYALLCSYKSINAIFHVKCAQDFAYNSY